MQPLVKAAASLFFTFHFLPFHRLQVDILMRGIETINWQGAHFPLYLFQLAILLIKLILGGY